MIRQMLMLEKGVLWFSIWWKLLKNIYPKSHQSWHLVVVYVLVSCMWWVTIEVSFYAGKFCFELVCFFAAFHWICSSNICFVIGLLSLANFSINTMPLYTSFIFSFLNRNSKLFYVYNTLDVYIEVLSLLCFWCTSTWFSCFVNYFSYYWTVLMYSIWEIIVSVGVVRPIPSERWKNCWY